MKLLTDLLFKCFKSDLSFDYKAITGGIDIAFYDGNEYELISSGWIKDYKEFEKPEDVLKRMHQEVDEYLNPPVYVEENETEKARAIMTEQKRGKTEYERKRDETGHRESDFR